MRSLSMLFALGLASLPIPACAVAPPAIGEQAAVQQAAKATLLKVEAADTELAKQIHESLAYAVFPSVGKGAIGIGAAYGEGVFVEGGVLKGYCNVVQGSLGLQLGGQSYVEIVCLSTPQAVSHFKSGVYSLSAQATAVAISAGSGAQGSSLDGVAVFFRDAEGLMAEASVGMQEFHYHTL